VRQILAYKMPLYSNRIRLIHASVAVGVCVSLVAALSLRAETQSNSARLSLKLLREIPFEQPLLMPQDRPWLLKRVVAMHPEGKRALVLLPQEKKITLQVRPASNLPERTFLLAWVGLATGQLLATREIVFSKSELFGFSTTDAADLFCVIAEQRVMILDGALSTVDWTQSELSSPQGEKRVATACSFIPETNSVLITFSSFECLLWECRSSLMVWKWKEKSASFFHWDQKIVAAVPLREDRVLVYRSLPDWLFRFRLEEFDLRTRDSSWAGDLEGYPTSSLVLTDRVVIRVDWARTGGSDFLRGVTAPERFRDAHTRHDPENWVELRGGKPREGNHHAYGLVENKVLAWIRGGNREPVTKFEVQRLKLLWPLYVARDNEWFAVRAIKLFRDKDNSTDGWDFNQFMIFSLDGSKRRLYTSEKFGPNEAITGLALSRDDKTLLVSTSSRLLVYSVEEHLTK